MYKISLKKLQRFLYNCMQYKLQNKVTTTHFGTEAISISFYLINISHPHISLSLSIWPLYYARIININSHIPSSSLASSAYWYSWTHTLVNTCPTIHFLILVSAWVPSLPSMSEEKENRQTCRWRVQRWE